MELLHRIKSGLSSMFNPVEQEEDVMPFSNPIRDVPESIPYFPSQRYITENKAPETKLTLKDIDAIRNASKMARESGLLTPELADMMLPMAMVEGRPRNYGIKKDYAEYASPKNVNRFKTMSVVGDTDHGSSLMNLYKDDKGDKFIGRNADHEGTEGEMANLMAAILSVKASRAKSGTVEEAVKLYNGKRKAIEDLGNGETQQADPVHYWKKVQEAARMLQRPENAAFYNRYLGK